MVAPCYSSEFPSDANSQTMMARNWFVENWSSKSGREPVWIRRRPLYLVAAALFGCAVSVSALAAPKTDVVILKNGDHLTGEIKSLQRGILKLSTDSMGTVSIQWDDVASLQSDQNIQVETRDGVRFLGNLTGDSQADAIALKLPGERVELPILEVVLMSPIESKGLSRLNGNITAGFNFTQASNIRQGNFGLNLNFRTELRNLRFSANAANSGSDSTVTSERADVTYQFNRLWADRWFTTGVGSLTQNDELGIDLRTSVGAGGGRYLIQSNQTMLSLEGGIMLSRENLAGEASAADTVEAYGALRWDWFRYDSPVLDLSSNLEVYPNLSDTGRVRGDFDIRLRWEVIEDLFWELKFYDSYDNRPGTVGASENDYGITTSLGYSF
jgi:hypothetical protein